MKSKHLFFFLLCQVLFNSLQAQCSKVYFYRFNGIGQCEFPVYVYHDGNLIATLKLGERIRAEVCSSGTYTFHAKLNSESINLAKTSIAVDGTKDYYIKVGCVMGVDMATIKNQDKDTGQRDIGRESRFVSGFTQISLGQPSLINPTVAPNSTGNESQMVKIVNNFKFEITDISRAGSTAQINYKITNLSQDDRMLYLTREVIHFYDDMGAIVYSDQLCLVNTCRNRGYVHCQGTKECIFQSRVFETGNLMPSGIPLNASLTFNNLNKRSTKLLRGAIWFGCCSGESGSGKPGFIMNEISYGEIVFPSPIDPNNPSNRIIADLGVELKKCEVVGTEARLNFIIRNYDNVPFDVVFQQGTAFDNQGNQYTIRGFAYGSDTKQLLNQWNNNGGKTLDSNSSKELKLFIDDIGTNATTLKRIDLFFNGFDLSWQDAPLLRNP